MYLGVLYLGVFMCLISIQYGIICIKGEYENVSMRFMFIHVHLCSFKCIYVYLYVFKCMYVCVCLYKHVSMCIYVYLKYLRVFGCSSMYLIGRI